MKNVLITGATGGIGSSILKLFYNNDYNICVTGTNKDKLNEIEVKYKGKVKCISCNLNDELQIENLVKQSDEYYGSTNILINNAGITKDNLILRMDQDAWKKVIDINLNSCFNLTKCSVREFIKKKEGVIINISSIVGVKGNAGQSNYAASKAGVNGFTKSIALELASRNIRCNAIAPGFIETDMTSKNGSGLLDKWIESIPLKRAGIVDDVSELCLFLASDKASYITGQIINVDGGLVT